MGIQMRLKALGYDCGNLDGIIGPKTKNAFQKFMRDRNAVVEDGYASPEIQDLLQFWNVNGNAVQGRVFTWSVASG
jgi:peptidoglycan hydrolase-like protein with peptidoglycan-binding domain